MTGEADDKITATRFLDAASRGDVKEIEALLAGTPALVDALGGYEGIVRCLMAKGAAE